MPANLTPSRLRAWLRTILRHLLSHIHRDQRVGKPGHYAGHLSLSDKNAIHAAALVGNQPAPDEDTLEEDSYAVIVTQQPQHAELLQSVRSGTTYEQTVELLGRSTDHIRRTLGASKGTMPPMDPAAVRSEASVPSGCAKPEARQERIRYQAIAIILVE